MSVLSQPLFVIGAPRSGTTFLREALNRHLCIQLTNENRVFVLMKDLLDVRSKRPDLVDREARSRLVEFLSTHVGELVERFYRDELGVTAPIWGDKHPPYADPCVLSGRQRSEPMLPQSGSCLRLIRRSLPTAKFIHIHRDPFEVAQSLMSKGWTPSIDDGVQVWNQYITEIIGFFAEIEPDRHLTLAYRDLIDAPAATATVIGRFLGLPDWSEVAAFLVRGAKVRADLALVHIVP